MKTYSPKPQDIERRWFVVDAAGAVLGRLASEVAKILRGKHKPIFAPHADTGDHVIVINARGVRLTGGKEEKKIAYRHSGYPGGLRETVYSRLMAERPVHVVEKAVRGMLPKNRLGRAMIRKLQVYEGPEHPHQAQQPSPLALGDVPAWTGLPEPKAKAARPRKDESARRPKGRRGGAAPEAKGPVAKRAGAKRTAAKSTTAKSTTAKRSLVKRATARTAPATSTGRGSAATEAPNAPKTAKPKASSPEEKPARARRRTRKANEES
jgi:large subunit ribosomal protein L13